jgi:hypothetical protein
MVTIIHLTGRITDDGRLEVELPANLPPGAVELDLKLTQTDDLPWELRPWTEEEIAELMKPGEPKTGAEIVERIRREGGWEDMGITDSVAWLEEKRRQRQERNKW